MMVCNRLSSCRGKGKLFAYAVVSMDIRSPSGVAVSIRAMPLGESRIGAGTLESKTGLPGQGNHHIVLALSVSVARFREAIMKILPNILAFAILAFAPFVEPGVAVAQPKGCPPGLAKKNPACVPPGQAKKGGSLDQRQYQDRRGTIVDRGDLIFLDNYARYDLPRLPDRQRYAVVDDRIVVIDRESYEILQLMQVFRALTD